MKHKDIYVNISHFLDYSWRYNFKQLKYAGLDHVLQPRTNILTFWHAAALCRFLCDQQNNKCPFYPKQHTSFLHCKKKLHKIPMWTMDNGGTNQTTWGSKNSYSLVFCFSATVFNIGIWRIPTCLFYSVLLL